MTNFEISPQQRSGSELLDGIRFTEGLVRNFAHSQSLLRKIAPKRRQRDAVNLLAGILGFVIETRRWPARMPRYHYAAF
jgi:hypothetical protein